MNIDKREMNNIRKENLSEKRTILLFEIVSINSLLIVQRYHFHEKELSESLDERYLFNRLTINSTTIILTTNSFKHKYR
jgi:hypothetical protein